MRITDVRMKVSPPGQDRLCGYCTITLDGAFVVRDIKIIDGPNGLFVAMPSRKLMDHCPDCRGKNHLRARFCNTCGGALDENRHTRVDAGRVKLHSDLAHPINAVTRSMVQDAIIGAYRQELARSQQPGYVSPKLDDVVDDYEVPVSQ
jgi:stage V sporulation protein G